MALLFAVFTCNVLVLCMKEGAVMLFQVMYSMMCLNRQDTSTEGEKMVSICSIKNDTKLKDELIKLLRQGHFCAC